MEDLQMGAAILKEYVTLETEKEERAVRAKRNEKAAHDAAAERVTPLPSKFSFSADNIFLMQVKLAFIDDRKTKEQRDEIEREQRAARALQIAQPATPTLSPPRRLSFTADHESESEDHRMPGSGHVLGSPITNRDEPPAYEHAPEITD
jgi:hypothetical protein